MTDTELMPQLLPELFKMLVQRPLSPSSALFHLKNPTSFAKRCGIMLLVPITIWSQHIRRAEAEWWQGILPQWNSLGPDRVVLSAKHDGKRGSRTWAIWSVDKGRTKATPYWGALHGWLFPRLPEISRDITNEKSIFSNPRLSVHSGLALREAWVVAGPGGLGPDNCLLHCATGNELKRVWYLTTDQLDGLGQGTARSSLCAGKRSHLCWPKPDELIEHPIAGRQTRLKYVAEEMQQKMLRYYDESKIRWY